jgi:hypothetical protein
LCLAAAVLWSLPMLASGLLALLRYGFGSVFVVGESVASALLRSTGADIAGTLGRLEIHPLRGALEAGAGLLLSAGAASLARPWPGTAAALAILSGAEAWWYGLPLASALLWPAALCAIVTVRG